MSTNERIFELRSQLGFSRIDFARELNVSLITIHYWESGQRKPSFKHTYRILKLAKKCGIEITLDWIRPEAGE